MAGDRQQLIAQRMLRRVAFAGIANDDEAEVSGLRPGGLTANVIGPAPAGR